MAEQGTSGINSPKKTHDPSSPSTVNDNMDPKDPKSLKDTEHDPKLCMIQMKDFSAVDIEEKLNLLMVAINKINANFHHKFEDLNKQLNDGDNGIVSRLNVVKQAIESHHEVLSDETDGILPRMRDVESAVAEIQSQMETLIEEKTAMQDELYILKGYTQIHDKHIDQAHSKITDLTARNMKNSIIINGILEDKTPRTENCKEKVHHFFRMSCHWRLTLTKS